MTEISEKPDGLASTLALVAGAVVIVPSLIAMLTALYAAIAMIL